MGIFTGGVPMKHLSTLYIILILFWVVLISGCPHQPPPSPPLSKEETEEIVRDADATYNDIVETLRDMRSRYQDKLDDAYSLLTQAKSFLQSDQRQDASNSAVKSLSVSHQLEQEIYKSGLFKRIVNATKQTLEQIIAEDHDNPLEDFIPVLDDILEDVEQVEQGVKVAKLRKIQKDFREVKQIIEFIQTGKGVAIKTITSDISFGMGQYNLSPGGQKVLVEFFQEILKNQNERIEQYPNRNIMVKIKAVGYTDQVGFKEGTRLVSVLMKGVEHEVPKQQPARRQYLNQRLSLFRARTITEYLIQLFSQTEGSDSWVHIEQESIGRGEEMPFGINQLKDSRRRICKISSYVIAR